MFDDKLLMFSEEEKIPFAYRSALPEATPYRLTEGKLISRIGHFEIFDTSGGVVCKYTGKPSVAALIAPLDERGYVADKAEIVVGYLKAAYSLELSVKSSDQSKALIQRLAERCGCLTDIYREDSESAMPCLSEHAKPNSAIMALCLPMIALMYRRISALRGFNFKISFADEIPCLAFSAKVILEDKNSFIPEQSILRQLADNSCTSFAHRLSELEEECDGGKLFRLSVAICPQTADPSGILRAPRWKAHTDSVLSGIDLDVPGKY